jgi:hypothetical protein
MASGHKSPPIDVVEACRALNIVIDDPLTFDFGNLRVPGTAKDFKIMLHQVVDA